MVLKVLRLVMLPQRHVSLRLEQCQIAKGDHKERKVDLWYLTST